MRLTIKHFYLVKIIFRCNGKPDCQVSSTLEFAGSDPCSGTDKYTEVAFSCA